ncbi:MAG: MarR family winged helix-turn-helix transcriptional regulator [Gaiellaceae bacterium]
MPEDRDQIDEFLDEISPELPKLDLEIEGIVDRIDFLHRHLKRTMEETLADHGLGHGEWSVLGMLKRPGPPYRRTPGQLARQAGLSTGAMTNRLDRLEEAGLVTRRPDPDDRRSIQVELTPAGHRAWEESVGAQSKKEALIVSALTAKERAELNRLLRRIVRSAEQHLGPIRRGKDHE